MKELRSGSMRVLFAFDPRRVAILLIGGDKRDEWQDWYEEMIPVADDLYDNHVRELQTEGLIDGQAVQRASRQGPLTSWC
jgi:hypothetical protein